MGQIRVRIGMLIAEECTVSARPYIRKCVPIPVRGGEIDVKFVPSHWENEASCRFVKEPVHETRPVLRRISGDASEE